MADKRYIVTTPNPEYQGKICGIRFENGRAFVNEFTIDPFIGLTVEEVITKMREDFNGYKIVPEPTPEPTPKAKRTTKKDVTNE